MPVINGIYLKDFTALPSAVTDVNIIPIAIAGNQVAYRTTVGGIITDARITGKLLTGLSVTGGAVVSTDTILQAFGKVQNQLNNRVSSVGLTMPLAFSVANSPVTGSGTLAVTANGLSSQYIRGDGQLADFPTGGGGGGSSVSYYLNGSVNQGTFVGNTYYEMNKVPVFGAGTDFSIGADGYIAQFITDANDPNSLLIPAGNWNFETYFSASSGGGTPSFYVELYKYSGTTFTLIATNSSSPELIAFGTTINPYFSALAVPETVLLATDRLAIRIYVTHSGRTITLHTENSHLCQIITTFTTGLQSLNGLTKQTQYFAVGTSGTDFNISSSVDTHTFNIPSASASNRGLITTGIQTIAGAKTFSLDTVVNGVNIGRGGGNIATNTRVGNLALLSNTTGIDNSAFGASSLSNNTTGFSNTGIGSESLINNTSGSENTAIGIVSLGDNTTGDFNTAIGRVSLGSNISGSYNVGIGADAGYVTSLDDPNSTSNNSIFLGSFTKALANNQTNQIVIGHSAVGLGSNTTVLGNSSTLSTAIWGDLLIGSTVDNGTDKLQVTGAVNITGQLKLGSTITNNTFTYTLPSATGTLALTSNLSAYLPLTGGTLTGNLGGTSATFSSSVTAFGIAIDRSSLTLSNQLQWRTSGSNDWFLGSSPLGNLTSDLSLYSYGTSSVVFHVVKSSGNVGIGTTSPSAKLDVNETSAGVITNSITLTNASNTINTEAGLFFAPTVATGNIRGARITGFQEDGNNAIGLKFYTGVGATISEKMRITSGGNVLIGTTTDNGAKFRSSGGAVHLEGNGAFLTLNSTNSNTFKIILQDSGTVRSYLGANGTNAFVFGSNSGSTIATINNSTGAYTALSDINKKKDIEESQIGLNAILGLKPTLYRMKTDANNTDKHLGFIAQEVKEFIPQAYKENGDFIGLDYNPIIATLVKAIQELNEKIIQLENK